MLALGGYASSSVSDEEEVQLPTLAREVPKGDTALDSEDDEDEGAMVGPVLPVSVGGDYGDGDNDEDDDDGDDADEAPVQGAAAPPVADALPPPDFADWDPAEGAARVAASAPSISALGKRQRGGPAGAHQVSSGFKAAVTRHDQLVAAKAAAFEESAEARRSNGGLSSAYDSVFRAAEGETLGRDGKPARTRVNGKGKVVHLSKKEAAREDALEETLRG